MSDITLSDLISLARHNRGGDHTQDEEANYKEAQRKMAEIDITFSDAADEVKKIQEETHVELDQQTAFQLVNDLKLSRSESKQKMYQILIDDISSAYAVIEGQLKGTIPNWEKEYILKQIDVDLILDDVEWRSYIHINNFDNLTLPGCASAVVPICLRFRKNHTQEETANQPWSNEIRFVDLLCMMPGNPSTVKRVQMLKCGTVSSNM